jgi:hypothetical protein
MHVKLRRNHDNVAEILALYGHGKSNGAAREEPAANPLPG